MIAVKLKNVLNFKTNGIHTEKTNTNSVNSLEETDW
mgnify:CR=1 FL=1